MYEELVKRLRDWPRICAQYDGSVDQLHDEAADAIEGLLAERDEVNADSWKTALEVERDEHRWIPVKERLPEHAYGEGDSVLTVSSLGSMLVLYFDGGNWCYPTGEALTTARKYPITHWMSLPEPPMD